jgi:sugar O-acyltransferase (sialic acid O-acetyltransferase NeuD family)
MKDIAIFGAGGFGKEVSCLIRIINDKNPTWNFIGFYDDDQTVWGKKIGHYGKCLGGLDALNNVSSLLSIVVAVASPNAVKAIVGKINNDFIDFPNIIHPGLTLADPETFKIGRGNIIQNHCSMSCDVTIGDFNVFNGSIVCGHDDLIGSYNTFMPAIRISGEVKIGDGNFFGVASIILQQLKIGNNIRLGAGSVLMTKPKDGNLYMGNPAKKVKF